MSSKEYRHLDGTVRRLVQRVGDGSIITRFDKTPLPIAPTDVVCPHFLELKWATGCPYQCAWCYLNGTLRFLPEKTRPRIKDYGKVELHVRSFLEQATSGEELLNTGELADSLMWEQNGAPFSKFILNIVQGQDRHKVLFVTKSVHSQHLLHNEYQQHAVISFSLNAEAVARAFEKGAPPVGKRIETAGCLSEAGYQVRVRIDPLVPILDWDQHYLRLVDQIFSIFTPARITLGSLRGLQSTINQARDKSWTTYLREWSNWGRKVEFSLRANMYKRLIDYLKGRYHYSTVSLCKETVAMWEALGLDYRQVSCNCLL